MKITEDSSVLRRSCWSRVDAASGGPYGESELLTVGVVPVSSQGKWNHKVRGECGDRSPVKEHQGPRERGDKVSGKGATKPLGKRRVTKATLQKFLNECDTIAPWFAALGNLMVASWDKLGKDLDFAWEQGTLKPSVSLVWHLVGSCLEDKEGNKKAIANGQAALEMLQEERSEQSETEREKEKWKGNKKRVYPSLGDLRKELKEPGEDSESEQEICEDEDLMEDEEGEIFELMEKHSFKVSEKQHPKMATVKQGHHPIAPPPYCLKEEVGDGNQQRYHEPIDFKIVKALAESVRTYGVTAAFTIAQVEALTRFCMTPGDWMNLVRACLSLGQYLDWRAFQIEFANDQSATNCAAGNQCWDVDMLLGQGRFAQQQTGYPPQVYDQINQIAIGAWRSLPNKDEVSGNLTKILQGPMEPFSDFVARMVESAGRVFGDPDAAMPLIKQLTYEQRTKECRAAITPYKEASQFLEVPFINCKLQCPFYWCNVQEVVSCANLFKDNSHFLF
ncbi:Retroviral matrix containing protein [Cricetulus griseus]|uniref:Retroviral matrix containing protein n=1 Tax=Cricetulus griseus TaxID=10029 RepID=A0A061I4N3_CRIGR|nr:Retroviral matrix containing protein [Cricetulus griseus]